MRRFQARTRAAGITVHQASARGTRCTRRFRILMSAASITERRASLRVDSLRDRRQRRSFSANGDSFACERKGHGPNDHGALGGPWMRSGGERQPRAPDLHLTIRYFLAAFRRGSGGGKGLVA